MQNTEKIVLRGQDAIDFQNTLYHPTKEQIRNQKESIRKIQNDVIILEQTEMGLTVVNGLDFSFLDSADNSNTWL